MPWDERLIDPLTPEFAADLQIDGGLSAVVELLMAHQLVSWPGLAEGVKALSGVSTRTLRIEGTDIILQHNPARIVSTSARVDEPAIRERPCFLCSKNMPAEEKGVAFGQRFVVFCNPFPVLANHLVVVSRQHEPQCLDGNIETLLDLSRSLGAGYVALYNGARCGASAPDHLHFQAGRAGNLPVFSKVFLEDVAMAAITSMSAYGAGFLVVRGEMKANVMRGLQAIIRAIAEISQSGLDEPMVNLIAGHDAGGWRIIVFPRERHRPAVYYADGDERILVSPAAIDLGGLLVVPREEDFLRLQASDLVTIYSEVTYTPHRIESLLRMISGELRSKE